MTFLRLVYRAFNAILEPLGWALFLGGLVALPLTWPLDILPPFSDDPANLLITCVGWVLVSVQGIQLIQVET